MELKHLLTVNPRRTFRVLLSPSRTMAGRTDATLLFPQYNAEFAIDNRLPVMTTSSSITVLRSLTDTSSPAPIGRGRDSVQLTTRACDRLP